MPLIKGDPAEAQTRISLSGYIETVIHLSLSKTRYGNRVGNSSYAFYSSTFFVLNLIDETEWIVVAT